MLDAGFRLVHDVVNLEMQLITYTVRIEYYDKFVMVKSFWDCKHCVVFVLNV